MTGTTGPDDVGSLTRSERSQRTHVLLAQRSRAGSAVEERTIHEVVCLNMPVARDIARRYEGRGIPADDLEQVAYLGLVKAVRRYDADKGADFLSFAVPTVRGEVRRWFRDAGWVVRPPRSVQETRAAIAVATDELHQRLGRTPGPAELADHLGIERTQVASALEASGCFAPGSLDASEGIRDEGAAPGGRLGGVEGGYAAVEARVVLRPALRRLDVRERRILQMRFCEGATQAEIGAEIGVTQMQVSRILSGIFDRLREELTCSVGDIGRPAA